MLSRGVRGGGFCGGRGGFADSQTIPISNPDQGFLVNGRQEQPIIGRGGARGGRGTFGSGSITDFNNSAMNAQEERTFGGRGGFCGGRGDSQTIPTSNPDQGSLANDRQEQPIIGRGGARGGRGSLGSVSSATNLQQQPHSTRGRGEGLFGQASSRGRFASGGNSTPLSESVSKERQHNDENKTKNDFDRQEQPRSNVSNEEAGKERPLLRYRPVDKPIEDIFAEDYECKEKYIDVTDNDDKVEITGVENMMEMKFEKWEELNLHPQLHQNIKKSEYVRPRKIQSHVIPYIISGYDLKVHSETGSGKTAAFAIPIIQKILSTPDCNRAVAFPAPFAVIIEPTRELCRQVYDQFRKFANDTFIKVCKTYGETSMNASIMEIKRGCDILICTPGRIKHFIKAEFVDVSKMMFFVLDEVDHMLKNNFLEDIRALFEFSSFPPKNSRQSLLFSATFPPEIQHLATEMLREKFVFASNKKPISPNSKIEQSFFQVQSNQKKDFLLELLGKELSTSEDKKNGKLRRALVFVETRRDSDVVSHYLVMNGIKSLSLNGNRSQPEREEALKKFDKGDIDVLVATDVCARGIDIKNLDHVINFDLPKDAVTYVHRIGRTGRLNTGYATNFVDTEMDSALIPSLVELLQNSSNQIPEFMLQSPDSKGKGTNSNANYLGNVDAKSPDSKGNNSNSNVNYWSGVKSSNNKGEDTNLNSNDNCWSGVKSSDNNGEDTNWNSNDNYWGGVKSSNNKGEDTNWNTNDNYWGGVKSSNNKGEDTNLNSNDNCWSGVKSSDNNGEDTNWNSDDNYWNNGDVNDSWK